MYHIFVEFEMTCVVKGNLITEVPMSETIEIGTSKLNDNYELIDTFLLIITPLFKSIKKMYGPNWNYG